MQDMQSQLLPRMFLPVLTNCIRRVYHFLPSCTVPQSSLRLQPIAATVQLYILRLTSLEMSTRLGSKATFCIASQVQAVKVPVGSSSKYAPRPTPVHQ